MNVSIVTKKPVNQIKTLQTLEYPINKIYFARKKGFGAARNEAAQYFNCGLMLQLNDDLIINSEVLLHFAESIQMGEFAFQLAHESTGDRPCSRVFIIHVEDLARIGGFDNSLQYYFEDGEFFYRALNYGLKFRQVPDEAALHINHVHAFYRPKNWVASEAEICRLFVLYDQKLCLFENVDRFFVPFRDYRVVLQHFILRVVFLVYYILRGIK
jgi:hypothetical protein